MFKPSMPKIGEIPLRRVNKSMSPGSNHTNHLLDETCAEIKQEIGSEQNYNYSPIPEHFHKQHIERYSKIGYPPHLAAAIAGAKENLVPTPADVAFSHVVERTDVQNIRLQSSLTDECVYTYLFPMLKVFYLNNVHMTVENRNKTPRGLVLCSNPETAIATYGCIQKFVIDGKLPFVVKLAHQKTKIKDVYKHIQSLCHILVITHATLNNLVTKAEILLTKCCYIILQSVDEWIPTNPKTCPIQKIKDIHVQMKFSGFPSSEHYILVSTGECFDKTADQICKIFSTNMHYDIDLGINNAIEEQNVL
uniref:ATP-dependent RNA helicase TDRD12 n=1 Tax=Rhabditophanes sp. KR3021 TaxID=114890 RepID=A0AC35TJT2_9BILA